MARSSNRWATPLADLGLLLTAGLATQLALIEDAQSSLHELGVSPVAVDGDVSDPSEEDPLFVAIDAQGVVSVGGKRVGDVATPSIVQATREALAAAPGKNVLLVPDETRPMADVGVLWPAFTDRVVTLGAAVVPEGGAP